MTTPEPTTTKKNLNIWGGLFNILDKLQIKEAITRHFIFHPPDASYNFVERPPHPDKIEPKFSFKPKNEKPLFEYPSLKIKAYKVYRERKGVLYVTPLIIVKNKRRWSDYVMIYSHGNSCDLGTIYRSAMILSNVLKMDVITYDYTGYGIAPHDPSEKNTYADIETVLSFAIGKLKKSLDKVILCGYSLGSAPSVELATRFHSLPFIVLFCPLASCLNMLTKEKGKQSSKSDMFDNLGKMSKVWCDMLIVHGKDDTVITPSHSQELMNAYIKTHSYEVNRGYLLEVAEGNHQNLLSGLRFTHDEYTGEFLNYFENLLAENHTTRGKMGVTEIWENEEKKEVEEDSEEEFAKELEKMRVLRRNNFRINESVRLNDDEDDEEDHWNSSRIVRDGMQESVLKPEFGGRMMKFEMEYLKDLYSRLSINVLPEKWKDVEVKDENAGQFMLYRKAMF